MKKLNLAMIATALMFSFGCQKEIESNNEPNSPSSSTEDVNIVMKTCLGMGPSTYEWGFSQNNWGLTQMNANVDLPDTKGYPYISVVNDLSIFDMLFETIEYGTQTELNSHILNNIQVLTNYIDDCTLYGITDNKVIVEMYNFQQKPNFEYMLVYDLVNPNNVDNTLQPNYVYEFFLQ